MWFHHRVICPKDAEAVAYIVDSDLTGAVWSGCLLFARTCLSKNLGFYSKFIFTALSALAPTDIARRIEL